MSARLLLTSRKPATDWAELWVAHVSDFKTRIGDAVAIEVTAPADPPRIVQDRTPWTTWRAHDRCIRYKRVTIRGLTPNAEYNLRAVITLAHGRRRASNEAVIRTLPERLTGPGSRSPFVLMAGSCFSHPHSRGMLTRSANRFPRRVRPHARVLCGDQVYLDLPPAQTYPRNTQKLRRMMLKKYEDTWSERDRPGDPSWLGFGTTMFTADDHEFWNNYPFRQPHILSTWLAPQRNRLDGVASDLFSIFQTSDDPRVDGTNGTGVQAITVGTPGEFGCIDIRVLDGRRNRTRTRAHKGVDLAHVVGWLAQLKQPGVLVLSSPLFEKPAGKVALDFSLVDFQDYPMLARAIRDAPHDVVVISGDIHYGRFSSLTLPGPGSRRRIYEVVSSPVCLIGEHHRRQAKRLRKGKTTDARQFPARPLRGFGRQVRVNTMREIYEDNVVTLQFTAGRRGVGVLVEYWSTVRRGAHRRRGQQRLWQTKFTLH